MDEVKRLNATAAVLGDPSERAAAARCGFGPHGSCTAFSDGPGNKASVSDSIMT